MKQKLFVLLIILVVFGLLGFVWWNQAVKAPDTTNQESVIFVVNRGEGVKSIADRLQKEDLIRSPLAFFLHVRSLGIDSKIQAGDFRLNPSMQLATLADTLTRGTLDVWITIPEGWRNEEIALKLAKELSIPEQEFLKSANEGFMFPDTYLLPKDVSASVSASIFLANFSKKVGLDFPQTAKGHGMSSNEVITIASMVEREARLNEDRPIVASVILNRIREGMKLDIDATIQYALGYQPQEKTWWKKNLTLEDLTIESPYNTYKNAGLPPSPIANPGLASIQAVLDAPKTDYFYYVSDSKGKIHPARTLEEHNENITKYLNR